MSRTTLRKSRRFLAPALLALPLAAGGCATGSASSLSQATVFLSESSGEDVLPASAVTAGSDPSSPVLSAGNASLPLDTPSLANAVVADAAGVPGPRAPTVLATSGPVAPGLSAVPTSLAVAATVGDGAAATASALAQVTTSQAMPISTAGIAGPATSVMVGATVSPPPVGALQVGGIANTAVIASAAPATASVQTVAAATTSTALVTTGQVLGATPANAPAVSTSLQNGLLTTGAVEAARMCLAMKACR